MSKATLTRRSFLKVAAVAGAATAMSTQLVSQFSQTDVAYADEPAARKMYVSTCHGCIQACPCKVYVENDVVVKIEGHPEAPTNLGSMCLKGLNQIHTCYSPRRVLYPLKRTGQIGAENATWERISWDDAINECATRIADAIKKYGTYAFFCSVGGGGSYSFMQAMTTCQALGSPTVFEPGCAQCYLPRYSLAQHMYGGADQSIADCAVLEIFKGLSPYEADKGVTQDTKVVVLWGAQPSVSQTSQSGRGMAELRARGCQTIVVDPNMSPDAVKATVWLRVRPATDPGVILSWYRYIIENKLYDETFTKFYTNLPCLIDPKTKLPYLAEDVIAGYKDETPEGTPVYVCYDNKSKKIQPLPFGDPKKLAKTIDPEPFTTAKVKGTNAKTAGQIYKETAEPWTFEKVEEVCWVPVAVNQKAVDIYAKAKVAGICNGVPSDMQQIASQVPLGLMGLDMMMGYVNKPGATLTQNSPAPKTRPTAFFNGFGGMFGAMYGIGYEVGKSDRQNKARIDAMPEGDFPGGKGTLYVMNQILLDRLGMKNHKGLYHWAHSHIPSVLEAIKTGVPYKPRVWFDMSGNKLAMLGTAGAWYDAFPEVDFCICQYPHLTSFQVERADIVFPLEEWLEWADTGGFGQLNYRFGQVPVIHLGETASNAVPPQKVINKTSELLNAAMEAGETIVLGAVGAATGAGPAQPSQCTRAVDDELQTSVNASYLHENDPSKYKLHFPIGLGVLGGVQQDSVMREDVAKQFGAPDYAALMANPEQYQKPIVTPPDQYWIYGQHEAIVDDGLPAGFATTSRKCEIYCTNLIKMAANGFPHVYPRVQEPVDASIGQEVKDQQPDYEYVGSYSPICQYIEPIETIVESDKNYDPNYPLTITSGRVYYFHHGTMRHAAFARELYPVPDVRMNPKTAEQYGLKHGDWVKVTSHRGEITGRVYETASMHPKVLWMERFWNPESFDSTQATKTGGWQQMNINVITKNTAPYNEVYGSYTNRGFTVRIEKGEKPAGVWVEPKEFTPFLPTTNSELYPDLGTVISQPQTPTVEFKDWDPMAGPPAADPGPGGGA